MKRYSTCKDIQRLVRGLCVEGWIFEQGRRHDRIRPPHGCGFVPIPGTPSDHRAFLNFSSAVRRLAAVSGRSQEGA